MKKVLLILWCLLVAKFSISQTPSIDSLNKLYLTASDTAKVKLLCAIARNLVTNNPDTAILVAQKALDLSQRLNYVLGNAISYNMVGSCHNGKGKYDLAIENYLSSLAIYEKLKNKQGICDLNNGIGNAYLGLKQNQKALTYFFKSYTLANDPPKLDNMIGVTSFGLANIYYVDKNIKQAINYFKVAETLFIKYKNYNNLAITQTMLGQCYYQSTNLPLALNYINRSSEFFIKTDNQYGLASNYMFLGDIYSERNELNRALAFYLDAYKLNLNRRALDNVSETCKKISNVYKRINKPVEALNYYETFIQYNDSVLNTERNTAIADAEAKYESVKKEQELILKKSELETSNLKVKQRNSLIALFIGVSIIFLILLLFIYKQFKEKRKANVLLTDKNNEIQKQKTEIEEKNKGITDSINYSKHIQQAIIPAPEKLKEYLSNSFIIYKPKDIVSGDFYLLEELDDCIYLALVDCTGHGVPGAMLSVFANATIKNIIATNLYKTNPAGILKELCIQFKNNLKSHTSEDVNDGADIGLCCINKKSSTLYFSGANISLMQVKDNSLTEISASRFSISGSNLGNQFQFTNTTISYYSDDKFYLNTDGFVDQFGGLNDKKFKQKKLNNLLIEYSNLPFITQADNLINDFYLWKGETEQLDDVTLIGFEI